MHSTDPSCTSAPSASRRSGSAFTPRRRLGLLISASLPIAGLILAASGGARLSSDPAARAASSQGVESRALEWAVVDRLEPAGERGTLLAVLLVGDDEEEHVVSASLLPEGVSPGVWLRLRQDADGAPAFEADAVRTQEARARVDAKLAELRRRGGR